MSVSEIVAFASSNSNPTLIHFSDDYIDSIFRKKKTAIILFTNDNNTNYSKVFAEASKTYKGKLLFVQSGSKEKSQKMLIEYLEM